MSVSLSSTPEPAAISPRCQHFGECGGCQLQDRPYEAQLALKTEKVRALLEPLGWNRPLRAHASPQLWYYRNKMEFSFQDVFPAPPLGEDYLLLGLKRRKRWDKVMNLSECHLLSPQAPALLEAVHAWAFRENLEPYNLHRHRGFLRHLVLREAKNTPDKMVLLLSSEGKLPEGSFLEAVLSRYPASSVLWGMHAGAADVARSDGVKVLSGQDHITEEILGRRFRISPYSFFQTNSNGAAALYSILREWLASIGPKNVLDLYCGSGAIGLCVADLCERVMGVESVPSAVEDARFNASSNGIGNVEFLLAKAEDLLPGLAAQKAEIDAVIVDPPRCGLHPDATAALKELGAPWILYVSCNPKALAEDIRRLGGFYRLERVEIVDLFPHTEHVETVALLRSQT